MRKASNHALMVRPSHPQARAEPAAPPSAGTKTHAKQAETADPESASGVAIEDLDDLLGAIKDRLRRSVEEWRKAASDKAAAHTAQRIQDSVLECVAALDQLQVSFACEIGRCQTLEAAVKEAQVALVDSRSELAGTRSDVKRERHMALHDVLTSLPNRRYFCQRLDHALTVGAPQSRSLAVLYLDLDSFKDINDAKGHATGDEVLKIVGARLTRALRAEDMVSRIGGDEFACLLLGAYSRVQLERLADKLLKAVAGPCRIGTDNFSVKLSIGVALSPADGNDAEVLLKNADSAMYCAKRQQIGYIFFDQCAAA